MVSSKALTTTLLVAALQLALTLASEEEQPSEHDDTAEEHHEEAEPALAVLFPWFVQAVGILVFFMLTRSFHTLPYTAIMFLVGVFMGIGATRANLTDQLTESIIQWSNINSEVLLLVFLPGLLFRDAFLVNFYLFAVTIWQLLLFAFPMVLAGTTLTACVGKWVFPYDWSFNLAMTFGAILSATDPVAVSALLNEVGAPPRLKMHISGESMLNDGSSVVFFTLFSALYLFELGLEGGEEIDVARGVAIFFRMAGGGAAVGIGFGMGLILLLYLLNRRLDNEESVVQVAATISVAYLSFYAAEMSCEMSGVISVVLCGITTRAFGGSLISDTRMMENFWILVEHLLNTLLFGLGGVVWGDIISGSDERNELWTARDWGYLFLLYILVTAIRFVLIAGFYPITAKLGLGTSWQESVFMGFGGLRGAVGIALAISLDNSVWSQTEDLDARTQTSKLFGMVEGIAFLTLVINGTLAGPLLRKLGLAKSSDMRKRLVACLEENLRRKVVDEFVELLTDTRFSHVNFSAIKYHVPALSDLTVEELREAVVRHKENSNLSNYREPRLENILPYLVAKTESSHTVQMSLLAQCSSISEAETGMETTDPDTSHSHSDGRDDLDATELSVSAAGHFSAEEMEKAQELRLVFIELVRYAYNEFIESGQLEAREFDGFLVFSLLQSLEFAADEASRGMKLNDWEHAQMGLNLVIEEPKRLAHFVHRKSPRGHEDHGPPKTVVLQQTHLSVSRALAFIYAHTEAQEKFEKYFVETLQLQQISGAEKTVMRESEAQIQKAEALLSSFDSHIVESVLSHTLCLRLLNTGARHIQSLSEAGILKEREGHIYLEIIEKSIHGVSHCNLHEHPDELGHADRQKILFRLQSSVKEEMNVRPSLRQHMQEKYVSKLLKKERSERRRSSIALKRL